MANVSRLSQFRLIVVCMVATMMVSGCSDRGFGDLAADPMATPTLSFAEPFDTSEGHRNDGFIQQTYNQINTSHFVPTDRLDEALDELIVQAENAGWEIELLRESELSGSVIYTGVKTLGDGGASIRISGSRGWLLEDGVTFDTSQSVVSVALRS